MNKPAEPDQKAEKKPGPTKFGRRGKIFLAAFLLVLGTALFFKFYTNSIVGAMLKDIVRAQSKGFYELEFSRLNLDVFSNELTVNDLKLIPDSAMIENRIFARPDLEHHNIRAGASEAFIGVRNIADIYLNKNLHLSGIDIRKPILRLQSYIPAQKKKPKKDTDQASVHELILEKLQLLKINYFKFTDGSFSVERRHPDRTVTYTLDHVSLDVNNFHLDSAAENRENKAFFTDAVRLNIKDYELDLADKRHRLNIGEINISTATSTLELSDLRLRPIPVADGLPLDSAQNNLFDIFIPGLKISGTDFRAAYFDQELLIDSIRFKKPVFKIINPELPGRKKEKSDKTDIFALILNYTEGIEVKHFLIDRAAADVSFSKKSSPAGFSFQDLTLGLEGFRLDSNRLHRAAKRLYSDNFRLSVRNHTFELGDGLHQIQVGEFGISTSERKIYTKNAVLHTRIPAKKLIRKGHKKTFFSIKIPEAELTGMDIWKAWEKADFEAATFRIYRPDIHVYARAKPKTGRKIDFRNIYKLFGGKVKGITVRKAELIEADFEHINLSAASKEVIVLKNTSLSLKNFVLDEKAARNRNKIFYSDQIEARIKSHIFDLPDSIHELRVQDFYLSTEKRLLRIGPGRLYNKNEPGIAINSQQPIFDIDFKGLEMSGFDFRKAFLDQKYEADKLKLKRAEIVVKLSGKKKAVKKTGGKKNLFKLLKINSIELANSSARLLIGKKARLGIEEFSAGLRNLQNAGDSGAISTADSLYFEGRKFEFHNLKTNKILIINKLSLNPSKNTATFYDLVFENFTKSKTADRLRIACPQLRLAGLHTARAVLERKIIADTIYMCKPEILSVKNRPAEGKKFSADLIFDLIKNQTAAAEFGFVRADSGSVRIEVPAEKFSLRLPVFHLEAENWRPSAGQTHDREHFFYADNIRLEIPKLALGKQNLFISAQNTRMETRTGQLSAENFRLRQGPDSLKTLQFSLFAPQIKTNKIRFYDFYSQKRLLAGLLQIHRPEVEILKTGPASKTPFRLSRLSLNGLLGQNMEEITLDSLAADSLKFEFTRESEDGNKTFELADSDIFARNFSINKNKRADSSRILHSDNFVFVTRNYELPLKSGMQRLQAGRLELSTGRRELKIRDLALIPRLPKYDFAQAIGQQASWMYLKIREINIENIRPDELLRGENRAYRFGNLNLAGADLRIFSDSRLPKDPDLMAELPADMLKNLPFVLDMDTLRFSDSRFEFEYHSGKALRPGKLTLEEMSGQITGLTNEAEKVRAGEVLRLRSRALLTGTGELNLSYSGRLNHPQAAYKLKGHLAETDLRRLNSILERTAFFKIDRGTNKSLDFEMTANRRHAWGEMDFRYRHFRLSFIDKESEQAKGFWNGLITFAANTFVLRKNNGKLRLFRKAKMYAPRSNRQSVFAHWTAALISGLRVTVGAGGKKVRKAYRKHIKEMNKNLYSDLPPAAPRRTN